jgi:hypothetical protein
VDGMWWGIGPWPASWGETAPSREPFSVELEGNDKAEGSHRVPPASPCLGTPTPGGSHAGAIDPRSNDPPDGMW